MHPMLTIVIQAARRAGDFIAKSYEQLISIEIMTRGQNNFITNIDKKAKQIIIETIQKFYPIHTIIMGESGEVIGKKNNIQWVINSLNGITNFTKRLPHFAISIVVRINSRTEVAAIYNPMLNELFSAVRGQGAQLNNYRLRLKNINELEDAIIAMSFPLKGKQNSAIYINIITKLLNTCADFRCTGSVELDLAYVASGRVDGFCKIGLKPWDFMAGELLVREAGGLVTDFVGSYNYISSGNLLAGSPRMVKNMVLAIKSEYNNLSNTKM